MDKPTPKDSSTYDAALDAILDAYEVDLDEHSDAPLGKETDKLLEVIGKVFGRTVCQVRNDALEKYNQRVEEAQ